MSFPSLLVVGMVIDDVSDGHGQKMVIKMVIVRSMVVTSGHWLDLANRQ